MPKQHMVNTTKMRNSRSTCRTCGGVLAMCMYPILSSVCTNVPSAICPTRSPRHTHRDKRCWKVQHRQDRKDFECVRVTLGLSAKLSHHKRVHSCEPRHLRCFVALVKLEERPDLALLSFNQTGHSEQALTSPAVSSNDMINNLALSNSFSKCATIPLRDQEGVLAGPSFSTAFNTLKSSRKSRAAPLKSRRICCRVSRSAMERSRLRRK